jgi:hypothetical protein
MLGSLSSSSSSSSSVTISSSFDKIIAHDRPKANVLIVSNEFGLAMSVNIESDQNSSNNFMVYVDFFYNNIKIDFVKLDENVLYVLINEYQIYVNNLVKERKHLPGVETRYGKSISQTIRNTRRIKKIAQHLFQDLRALNVYTIHGLKNSIVARTAIELDADIVTIISPELLKINTKNNSLLNLHSINVFLVNYVFMYKITKFFSIIKTLTNLTRIASIVLWITFTIIPFYNSQQLILSAPLNNLNLYYTALYSIVNFIGIPSLLLKFIPKVIGYIIKYKIVQNLHMQ